MRVRSPKSDQPATRVVVAQVLFDTRRDRRAWLESTLLRPGQVAALFQVSRRTVTAWAQAGLLASISTPGGHRRYRASDIDRLIDRLTVTPSARRMP